MNENFPSLESVKASGTVRSKATGEGQLYP